MEESKKGLCKQGGVKVMRLEPTETADLGLRELKGSVPTAREPE